MLVVVNWSTGSKASSRKSRDSCSTNSSAIANSSKSRTSNSRTSNSSTITNSSDSRASYSSTIANSSDNRGGNRSSYRGGLISNMVDRLGNTNRDLLNSVNWGVDRGDHSLGRVGLNGSMVDMGSLNNLLDRVDLVGGSNWNSTRDSHVIGSSNVLVNCDDTLNRGRHVDWDINIVLLYIDLRDDVGSLGSDPGVGPDRGKNLLLDNCVSRGRASWDWGRGNGSIRCRWSWNSWWWKSYSLNKVLGSTSSIRNSWLRNVLNTSNNMLMSSYDRLDSSLDNLVSNYAILNTALNLGRSSSIAVVSLSNNSWGRNHWGSSN